jgi:phosphate transport system protein
MEEECLKLLALYQPVANDLRLIVAVLKINNDLERIGDHAKNMAEIVLQMAEGEPLKIPENMVAIFEKTKLMLRKALLAFVELDRKLAEAVLAMDDEVDSLCKSQLPLQIELIKHEPQLTGQHLMLLSLCRQLERIGDHASNIAEDIIYLLSGEIIRHSISGSMSRASSC